MSSENRPGSFLSDRGDPVPGTPDRRRILFDAVAREVASPVGNPDRVRASCDELRTRFHRPFDHVDLEILLQLARLPAVRAGPVAAPVFDLVADSLPEADDPGPLIGALLRSRDGALARSALALASTQIRSGRWALDPSGLERLADLVAGESTAFSDRETLDAVARLVAPAESEEPGVLLPLLESPRPHVGALAARLLDRRGEPVSAETALRLLGSDRHRILKPYLEATRATHADLIALVGAPHLDPRLPSVATECGEMLLCDVLGRLGWSAILEGLEVRRFTTIRAGSALPFLIPTGLAFLLPPGPSVRHQEERFLFIARGIAEDATAEPSTGHDRIARFRQHNLAHARLLVDFMALDALTRERLHRILVGMDGVVSDFAALFADSSPEAPALAGVYTGLKQRILAAVPDTPDDHLPGEVERLVLPFEEPRSLREIGTLHGLKRYLHQEALRLGSRLADAVGHAGRTVSLAVASPSGIETAVCLVTYADFEGTSKAGKELPHPVAVAVEGMARHLLHRHREFPRIRIFCYGNEVHYFLSYGLHPAFIRIDFSPPALGGMITLEYFGVSKNDLGSHPDASLDTIRTFLEGLDFEVDVESTRVRAHYDKERARHLGDLCDRALALFRLAPHLMDLDWTVGSLNLPAEARTRVSAAWLRFFREWGVLPIARMLTGDRRGILASRERSATGEREVVWSGEGPYRDRFGPAPPASVLASGIGSVLGNPEELPLFALPPAQAVGQLLLESHLLLPLARDRERGSLRPDPGCSGRWIRVAPPHPVRMFAEALSEGADALGDMASQAGLVSGLDRDLTWTELGSVNGYPVEHASLPLLGTGLEIDVLRDRQGVVRLARFLEQDEGTVGVASGAEHARGILRRHRYLDPERDEIPRASGSQVRSLQATLLHPNPAARPHRLPGEQRVPGFAAAPGRVAAPAAVGLRGRDPGSVGGRILVAPAVRPADNALIYRSAGVVFTGGGLLSHAGLLASQFHKPSLLVPGEWGRESSGREVLAFRIVEAEEEVSTCGEFRLRSLRRPRQREVRLEEGDLLVLDGDGGVLHLLGRSADVLALHAELGELAEAWKELPTTREPGRILVSRGRRLRAMHHLAKILDRLEHPGAVRYAVTELLRADPGSECALDRQDLLLGWMRALDPSSLPRGVLLECEVELAARASGLRSEVRETIGSARTCYEVLSLRLDLLQVAAGLERARRSLEALGAPPADPDRGSSTAGVEELACRRLTALRREMAEELIEPESDKQPIFRHHLNRLAEMDRLLGPDVSTASRIDETRGRLEREDALRRHALSRRRILGPTDGGLELVSGIGRKAAGLGELARAEGSEVAPPWFVVTDFAFRECLAGVPIRDEQLAALRLPQETPLGTVIAALIERPDLDPGEAARVIRTLWENVDLPEALRRDIAAALPSLAPLVAGADHASGPEKPGGAESPVRVALRSSAREEDTETAARAGEFETYLYVPPDEHVLAVLKQTWAGFWTERAIHNRRVLGVDETAVGGGVIVQRMIFPRASGVIQTVNVAGHAPREMLITAGLGVGEGIVSGLAGADLITVDKDSLDGGRPPRFRYTPGDKRTRQVFDRGRGAGTVTEATSFHQRFRPALEYTELRRLIETAARLERAYGIPLDIEFAVEDGRPWILQVRPVPHTHAVLRETLKRFPLAAPFAETGREP